MEPEQSEVVLYTVNALGNFCSSRIFWQAMYEKHQLLKKFTHILGHSKREEMTIAVLFAMANLTEDKVHRDLMIEEELYQLIWPYLKEPTYRVRFSAMSVARGLSLTKAAVGYYNAAHQNSEIILQTGGVQRLV